MPRGIVLSARFGNAGLLAFFHFYFTYPLQFSGIFDNCQGWHRAFYSERTSNAAIATVLTAKARCVPLEGYQSGFDAVLLDDFCNEQEPKIYPSSKSVQRAIAGRYERGRGHHHLLHDGHVWTTRVTATNSPALGRRSWPG